MSVAERHAGALRRKDLPRRRAFGLPLSGADGSLSSTSGPEGAALLSSSRASVRETSYVAPEFVGRVSGPPPTAASGSLTGGAIRADVAHRFALSRESGNAAFLLHLAERRHDAVGIFCRS